MDNIQKILEYLPHRYPFLLVDRILEVIPGKNIKALKNVTFNEPFFMGHFPGRPIMPGVLILEALAQTAGIYSFETLPLQPNYTAQLFFAGIDDARFKRIVSPGDQLILDVDFIHARREFWRFEARAMVGEELACSAKLLCARKDVQK